MVDDGHEDPDVLLARYEEATAEVEAAREALKFALAEAVSSMDAQPFIDGLGVIAEAPNGIERLKALVLDLAVRGHLASQDPGDESAGLLLSRIAEGSLVDESNAVMPVLPENEPWQLPSSWVWARFKQVVNFAAGRTPPTKDASYWSDGEGYRWVSIGDMPEGGAVTTTARRVSKRAADEIFRQQPDPVGTILMSFKLTIGKVARLAVPAFHNEAIISIETPFDETREYLFRTLPLLTKGGASKAAIMGNTLNKSSLTNLLIPLPPLAEQGRIVDKVDQLTDLCSDLERALTRRSGAAAQVASGLTARMAPTAVSH